MRARRRARGTHPNIPRIGHPQNHSRPNRFSIISRRQLGRPYRIELPIMIPVFVKVSAWAISGLAAFTLLWGASKPPDSQPPIVGQITTTLISVVPTIPTTTTTIVKGCEDHVNDAILYGWPISERATILRIIKRESGCRIDALNSKDPGGSRGLYQINAAWCAPNKYWPKGWLQVKGILKTCDDLYRPEVSHAAAYQIWLNSGWSPWNLPPLP